MPTPDACMYTPNSHIQIGKKLTKIAILKESIHVAFVKAEVKLERNKSAVDNSNKNPC